MSARLRIVNIARVLKSGSEEHLNFEPGVNMIVGAQNTGKSTWLRMFDYLMGESESAAEKFDEVIVEKYKAISATLEIDGVSVSLTREWGDGGRRSAIEVDGARVAVDELSDALLDRLAIPKLRFPQGNVFSTERAWPSLSWRMLLRHVYRRQDHWGEIVPQQPESEQHACLLQFLGLAEHLFADDLAKLVDKQKQIAKLQNRKDYFLELVQQIAPNLTGDPELNLGITKDSIENAKRTTHQEIQNNLKARGDLLVGIKNRVVNQRALTNLMDARARTLGIRDSVGVKISEIDQRIAELKDYLVTLNHERDRLTRAGAAAKIFQAIRVTNCPVCDQSVEQKFHDTTHCFLCHQHLPSQHDDEIAAQRRLSFEEIQLTGEKEEAAELLVAAQKEREANAAELLVADRELMRIEASLRPFQSEASAMIPEELALIDQKIGSLNAKLENLERLFAPLQTRDAISTEIDDLQKEVSRLSASVTAREENAEFEIASDRLTDGFITYLNAIRKIDQQSWTKNDPVLARVTDRRTQFLIGKRAAKPQLGGTLTLYFLFAYHFALLSLARYSGTHYPGFAILDFFPDIAHGTGMRKSLATVVAPFVELATRKDAGPIQFIGTCREFPPIAGVNVVRLQQVWR